MNDNENIIYQHLEDAVGAIEGKFIAFNTQDKGKK